METTVSELLLNWYTHNQRGLPWNETRDAYKIWISEIILQQTQVFQGLAYYERFITAFPDVAALASAPESAVMKQWEGLGYYTRARNLHKGARVVVEDHGGRIPAYREELLKIPGIGPYTSSAIAAFAFDESEAVVDGNVLRVLSRVFMRKDDISKSKTRKEFESLSRRILAGHPPADYNRAIMDLGATVCTPKKPLCESCPLETVCLARAESVVDQLPFNSKKIERKARFLHVILAVNDLGELIVNERKDRGIWRGLNTPPLFEGAKDEPIRKVMEGLPGIDAGQGHTLKQVEKMKHNLTHQVLHLYFYVLSGEKERPRALPGAIKKALDTLAFPSPLRKVLVKVMKESLCSPQHKKHSLSNFTD